MEGESFAPQPEVTRENALETVLDVVEKIEQPQVAQFRAALSPEWQGIFDAMPQDRQLILIALDSLPVQQYDQLFDLAAAGKLGHLPGVHNLNNSFMSVEGLRLAREKAPTPKPVLETRRTRRRKAA